MVPPPPPGSGPLALLRPRYAGAVSSRLPLRPPPVEVPPPLAWALARAFGPTGAKHPPVDGGAALAFARRFDLGARIAARTPLPRLAAEAGETAAAELARHHRQVAATVLVLEQVARAVAGVAAETGVPVVLLKGMALHLAGRIPLGSRVFSDIDVLAPRDAATHLQEELLGRGWRQADLPSHEHQLPPIHHPAGPVVEIHRALRGVRIGPGGAAADAAGLVASGLVAAAPGFPRGCHLPSEDVLAAHLLAHGLVQHLEAPRSYPLLRLLADLQDLGWDGDRWRAFLAGPHRWIARDVPRSTAEAAVALAARLAAGEPPATLAAGEDGPAVLLRHVLAGVLDDTYHASLRWRALTAGGGADHPRADLLHRLRHALWLTDDQIERIYGRPRTRLGYWGLRLWRPLDLVRRGLRYAAAWGRHRLAR